MSLICAGLKSMKEKWTINILEAKKAMWEGLKILLAMPERPREIVCLDLINELINVEDDLTEMKVCVEVILVLAQNQVVLQFKHCPSLQNGAMNSIARIGASLNRLPFFFFIRGFLPC